MLRLKVQKLIGQLRAALQIELLKMPKKIRKMTFVELCTEFDGSSNAVIERDNRNMLRSFMNGVRKTDASEVLRPKNQDNNGATSTDRTYKKGKNEELVLETPSGKGKSVRHFDEGVREPRSGEAILSANGSPLGTVVSNRARSKFARPPATQTILRTVKKRGIPGVAIAVEGVDVNEIVTSVGREELSSEEKKDARKQIMDLQGQLASLMRQLA